MREPYHARPTAKRLYREIRQRPTLFARIRACAGAHLPATTRGSAAVYLVGHAPDQGWRAWALDGLPEGWTPQDSYYEAATPILRYAHADGGRVEIHHASTWYPGAQDYDAATAAYAWELTGDLLRAAFAGVAMLATPATTGRECFLRTIPAQREYPALDPDTQDFLRSTLGQARIQGPDVLLADYPDDAIPGLWEYDGRLMYAALCWGLPLGLPRWVKGDDVPTDPYVQGRYHVNAWIPRDWPHPFGLLPIPATDDPHRRRWEYPAEPGATFSAWVDGAELHMAHQAGWAVDVTEALVFPKYRGAGPLDTWARKLVRLRSRLDPRAYTEPERPAVELARRAVRHLILTTIGAFQGRPHKVTRTAHTDTADEQSIPIARARLEGDWIMWGEDTGQAWPGLAHPEWCATVWGRGRARLMSGPGQVGALNLARGTRAVAFRTDAIYVTGRQPWPDTGRAGSFRPVRGTDTAMATPRSTATLLAARSSLTPTGER